MLNRGNLIHTASYTFRVFLSPSNAYGASVYTQDNFTTDANPFYDPGLANALGAFLYKAQVGDFLSKYLPDSGFGWMKNADGKVYSGIGPGGSLIRYGY